MRTFIGLFCVLAMFLTTVGCSGPAATEPTEEAADQDAAQASAETEEVVEEAVETTDEMPTEEASTETAPVEEEVVVETFDTEARPSLLLEIMLEPVTDMLDPQNSGLSLPGLGG